MISRPLARHAHRLRTLCTATAVLALFVASAAPAGATAIFVMKIDGTAVRKVIEVKGCRGHGSPRWSHDDKRLAFDASPAGTEVTKFYVVNV